MQERYSSLFSPVKIGSVTLKNRVILTAMGGTSFLGHDGKFNPHIREYYMERVRGGVGLIVPGVTGVKDVNGYLYEKEDIFLGPVKEVIDEIHSYGAKYFFQLGAGFGRAQLIGLGPGMDEATRNALMVAPSDGIPNVWMPDLKHRGLTREEIRDIVDAFGKSALMCKKAGIDGVEIHAIHEGYLLDQFTISSTNERTDEYGGSLENRFRFITEVIREIKKTCGEDYPVMIRYSVSSKMRGFNAGALPGEDYKEFGRSLEESPAAARLLEAAGADALDADNGSYDSWWWAHPPVYMPLHCNFPEVSYIKKFVNIPVFCAGRMEDPEFADKAIAAGEIDGIGVARQFLADPEWLNKAREGREEDIRPCIACHNGCFGISLVRTPVSRGMSMAHCAVNPTAMEETEWDLTEAEFKKNIAIVGGGVGGMESARILTLRGHKVTLFEKTGELGGVFIAAAAPSFKEKDRMLLDWYRHQMDKLGVDVRLNTEAKAEDLRDYDEIIVATGAAPRKLDLPGLDDERVVEAIEYLRDTKPVGEEVVIIGGGLTGVEIAYDLVKKGKKPAVVEMQDDILQVPGLCAANSNMLREIIRYYEIPVYTSARFEGVESGDRLTVKINRDGEELAIETDSVVMSVGYVPVHTVSDALAKAGVPEDRVHVIGDAREVGNLMSVIREAYELCYSL
ncbi:MAG: FAD-dependent oxidoreductase [Oscillospiraceae bacterium]|nr:FAD-dependent oxidoreductase [Oscillospiraceae bacterium]